MSAIAIVPGDPDQRLSDRVQQRLRKLCYIHLARYHDTSGQIILGTCSCAMSKFKKFEARIDKLEQDLQKILDGHSDSGPGGSRSAAVDDGTAAPASGGASRGRESAIDSLAAAVAAIESASQNADALEANVARMDQEVASLRGEMDGYLRRAKESDPDKRVYGEKMTKKVLDADVKF